MSPSLIFVAITILLLLVVSIDFQFARKFYISLNDYTSREALTLWFEQRRRLLGGAAVLYLVTAGAFLYIHRVGVPGMRLESSRYRASAGKFLREKKYDAAVIQLRNAVTQSPDDMESRLLLARLLTLQGRHTEALESYREIIALDKELYAPHLELGRLAFTLKNNALALSEAGEAARLQPGKAEPGLLMAQIQSANGKEDQALAQCRTIIGKEFDLPELRRQFVTLLMRRRLFAEALQVVEGGLKGAPDDPSLKIMQAEALEGLGHFAKVEALLQAVDADPASPASYLLRGELMAQRGDYVAALKMYEAALKRAPDNELAMNNFAALNAEHGFDMELSATLAARLYAKSPKDPAVADTLGWTLYRQGKVSLALPLLRQGVAGQPGNPVNRYHLGAALLKSGHRVAGKRELSKALRLSGNFDGAAKARELM